MVWSNLKGEINYSVYSINSTSLPIRDVSKSPSGCLKTQTIPNHKYVIPFLICHDRTLAFFPGKHFVNSLSHMLIAAIITLVV